MSPFSLKNPARLIERLAVSDAGDLLLVDVPQPLEMDSELTKVGAKVSELQFSK